MSGICIINESLYANPEIQKVILGKGLKISFAGKQQGFDFYSKNREKLWGSLTLNGELKNKFPDLVPYFDEPISNPTVDSKDWELVCVRYKDSIVGELTDSAFDKIGVAITYTSYNAIFNFFGWRIPIPFTTQLSTWIHIRDTYLNKFPICWVKLGQRAQKNLIEWAKANGKEVWIYTEETDVNKLVKAISEL